MIIVRDTMILKMKIILNINSNEQIIDKQYKDGVYDDGLGFYFIDSDII